VLRTYSTFFKSARPPQGIGQAIPDLVTEARHPSSLDRPVHAMPVLGGLLPD